MGTPAGNGQRQRQFKLRTFVNERRQEPREMKSVQDTGGRWTLHGLDASARVRRMRTVEQLVHVKEIRYA